MTDRQPGAPGQYKLRIDPSVAQNLLIGEEVTVTLKRDDLPIVEGTPYNKASVLPDELARLLCPGIANPTPANALDGLRKKKQTATLAASGWTEYDGHYIQRIPIGAITGDNIESVKSWPVYSDNFAKNEAIMEAASAVTFAGTESGGVIFVCMDEKPEADIPIAVEVSR